MDNDKLIKPGIPGFKPVQLRTIQCGRCLRVETELVLGASFPGWGPIPWLANEKTGLTFMLCPECVKRFSIWINEAIKIAQQTP